MSKSSLVKRVLGKLREVNLSKGMTSFSVIPSCFQKAEDRWDDIFENTSGLIYEMMFWFRKSSSLSHWIINVSHFTVYQQQFQNLDVIQGGRKVRYRLSTLSKLEFFWKTLLWIQTLTNPKVTLHTKVAWGKKNPSASLIASGGCIWPL